MLGILIAVATYRALAGAAKFPPSAEAASPATGLISIQPIRLGSTWEALGLGVHGECRLTCPSRVIFHSVHLIQESAEMNRLLHGISHVRLAPGY